MEKPFGIIADPILSYIYEKHIKCNTVTQDYNLNSAVGLTLQPALPGAPGYFLDPADLFQSPSL